MLRRLWYWCDVSDARRGTKSREKNRDPPQACRICRQPPRKPSININAERYRDGESFTFDIKGERGKIDFGDETPSGLRALLRTQPVIVHTHHDRRARPVISVFICKPSEVQITAVLNGIDSLGYCKNRECIHRNRTVAELKQILRRENLRVSGRKSDLINRLRDANVEGFIFGFPHDTDLCPNPECLEANRAKYQPYLFAPDDSAREALSPKYHQMGARLVAHGHLGRDGFVVDLFDPEDGLSIGPNSEGEAMLLRLADEDLCPDLSVLPLDDEQLNPEYFTRTCIAEFYESMIPYLDSANLTRNIIASNLAEHLQTLVYGGIGMRTDAKGQDIVVPDSIPAIIPPNLLDLAEVDDQLLEADVKLVTGLGGDEMGVEDDATRINLQRKTSNPGRGRPIGHEAMLDWVSLLPVRVMHEIVEGVEQLRVACFDLPEGGIQLFRDQVTEYLTGNPPLNPQNKRWRSNMQYHAGAFELDTFGNENHRLEFERTFEYTHIFD